MMQAKNVATCGGECKIQYTKLIYIKIYKYCDTDWDSHIEEEDVGLSRYQVFFFFVLKPIDGSV